MNVASSPKKYLKEELFMEFKLENHRGEDTKKMYRCEDNDSKQGNWALWFFLAEKCICFIFSGWRETIIST